MLVQIVQLAPFLISIIGGGLIGFFLFRPLARHVSRTEELEEEEAHKIILLFSRNSCLILIVVSSAIAFAKYGLVSVYAPIVIAYLTFEILSATWGVCMGMEKRFIPMIALFAKK